MSLTHYALTGQLSRAPLCEASKLSRKTDDARHVTCPRCKALLKARQEADLEAAAEYRATGGDAFPR